MRGQDCAVDFVAFLFFRQDAKSAKRRQDFSFCFRPAL
jgi:hypothetical protein